MTSVLLQMKHEELRHLSAGPKGFDDLTRKSKNIHKNPKRHIEIYTVILNSWVLWLDCRIPFILLICQDSEVSLQELSNTVLHGFQFPLLHGRPVVPFPRCHAAESSWWQCWGLSQLYHEDDASKCIKMLHQCTGFSGNVSLYLQILTYTLQGVTVVTATKNAEINELVHRNTQPRQMTNRDERPCHITKPAFTPTKLTGC